MGNNKKKSISLSKNRTIMAAVNSLIIGNLVLFLTAVFSPIITLDKMIFFHDTVTVASGIFDLFHEGYYILFIILFLFSLALPFMKLVFLFTAWNFALLTPNTRNKILYYLEKTGKWSMLDVLVVAVIVISVKLGDVAKVELHYGVYMFITSVFITLMLAGYIQGRLLKNNNSVNNSD